MSITGKIFWVAACAATAAAAADKYAADWLGYGAGARALAMGGAYVALADDATAAYWNAAGLSAVERASFSAMHSYAFNGLAKYDSVYGAYNFGKYGVAGGGMLRFAVDEIPDTDWAVPGDPNSRPVLKGYFNWADYGFYLSYGRKLEPWLNVGGSAVIIHGSHYKTEYGSSGETFNLGGQAGPFGPVAVGVNFQNIYSRLKWGTGAVETIPASAKVGAAYRYAVPAWASEFAVAADASVIFADYGDAAQVSLGGAALDLYGGGEWSYRRTVAIRLGAERGAFAGGVGLTARALGSTFGVDYAYLANPDLEGSHRVSASVAF